MKKCLSILLVLCLLLGTMSMLTVSAASYSGTPTLAYINGTWGSTGGFYFTSTDTTPAPADGNGGWTTDFVGVDDNSGVFFNGSKTGVPIRKIGADLWYACLDGALALSAGDRILIKGTFQQSTDTSVQVTLKDTYFEYDGSTFCDYYYYIGTPMPHHNDSSAGFYFIAGDSAPVDSSWATQWYAVSGKGSVTKNGSEISIDVRKVEPSNPQQWYAVLSDYSVTPAVGDVFTIDGTFSASAEERIHFDSMSVKWDGSLFRIDYTGTPQYKRDDGNGAGVYFSAGDSAPITGWGINWDKHSGGVYKNGVATNVAVRKVGNDEWYILLGDFSQTAVAGDLITINGTFRYLNSFVTFSEAKFVFDGSSWSTYTPPAMAVGTTTALYQNDGTNGFYFTSDDGLTAPGWNTYFYAASGDDNGFFANGTKYNVNLQKTEADLWYIWTAFGDAYTPSEGDTAVIKGIFEQETNRDVKVQLAELTLVWKNGEWVDYNGTTTQLQSNNGTSGFYMISDDGLPAPGWETYFYAVDGENNGFFMNGTKYNVNLQKTESNVWYVDTQYGGVNPSMGDKAVIKGVFAQQGNTNNKVSLAEMTLIWTGSAWVDFTPTEVNLTGISYGDTRYNTSDWGMYFIVDGTLPGDTTTYYSNVVYEVNGTAYSALGFYAAADRLYVPVQNVPAQPTEEYTIVIKAGYYEGLTAGTNAKTGAGIYLTKDFTLVIGTKYEGSTLAVNYLEGTSVNGVHLLRTDDAPVTGWDATGNLLPTDENSGVYIDGVRTETPLRKYEEGKYYVCMVDAGYTASEGTIVTLKGTFTLNNLYTVTIPTCQYIYTDGAWKIYVASSGSEDVSTGILGNANSDANFNICDAVTTIRYVAGATDEICVVDADINCSGTVDANDVRLIRRMLLGDLFYKGEPLYEDDEEMRLAAYSGPRHSDGSVITSADNQLFADYAAAGFTTVLSEHDGIYENAEFATYMDLAAKNGLDVMVFSGAVANMANGTIGIDQSTLNTIAVGASQYANFRGFMLGDEPALSQSGQFLTITGVLRQIAPGCDLMTSCHPLYAPDSSVFGGSSSLSLAENYANYVKTYGSYMGDYTYDFYPFREKTSWSWSSFSNVTETKLRSEWYQNLELAATGANGNYTTGLTVQAYAEDANSKDRYRELSQADILFQVYNGLAYGMKTINYFTYTNHWALPDTTQCMVMDGVKQQLYYDVQAVNAEIKKFDHVMLKFNWQGTIGISGDNEDGIMNYVGNYTSSRIASSSATNDAIIGCLKDRNAYDGFMLVNATDPIDGKSSTVTVKFNDADHAKVYVNGVESIVELTDGTYTATLKAGQGVFVIPYMA